MEVMTAPAGWYQQSDGQQRYWDGELWTQHFAPGIPDDRTAGPTMGREPLPGSGHRRFCAADFIGWGSLALVALLGAMTSGLSGAAVMLGLFLLIVAGLALIRGQVAWARLGSRAAGGAALAAALGFMTVGAVTAPPISPAPVIAAAPLSANSTRPSLSPDPSTPAESTVSIPTPATIANAPTTVAKSTPSTVAKSPTTVARSTPTVAPATAAVERAESGSALAAVAALTVKGRAPKTGYARSQFGQSWFDTDKNGCDTRNDMLRRDLGSRQMRNACKVLAGTLADPYTATSIRFVYGGASEVDIDHVVALSDAWQKGAATWPAGKRLAMANDPLNLLAVDASANRSKGDSDTATWLPANRSYRCAYVARQVAVKGKYGVWVTSAERDAMTRVLATCPSVRLPGPGSAPVIAALPHAANPPAPRPQPSPAARPAPARPVPAPAQPEPAPPAQDVYYENCAAARAAGAAPIMRGESGYASKLDRDDDGVACE